MSDQAEPYSDPDELRRDMVTLRKIEARLDALNTRLHFPEIDARKKFGDEVVTEAQERLADDQNMHEFIVCQTDPYEALVTWHRAN